MVIVIPTWEETILEEIVFEPKQPIGGNAGGGGQSSSFLFPLCFFYSCLTESLECVGFGALEGMEKNSVQ